jgi:hypothetical protein
VRGAAERARVNGSNRPNRRDGLLVRLTGGWRLQREKPLKEPVRTPASLTGPTVPLASGHSGHDFCALCRPR